MQRRQFIQVGLTGGAILAVGGGLAALWEPALEGVRLSAAGRQAMGAVARAVLEASLPEGDDTLARHLDQFEGVVQSMPAPVRAELQQLFSLCTHAAGRLMLWETTRPLHAHSTAELQARLQALRDSRLALRQQAYFALRDLHAAAHFAQPSAWAAIGYPGPKDL